MANPADHDPETMRKITSAFADDPVKRDYSFLHEFDGPLVMGRAELEQVGADLVLKLRFDDENKAAAAYELLRRLELSLDWAKFPDENT